MALSSSVFAVDEGGWLANSVEITSVANTSNNAMAFTVETTEHSKDCSGKTITFPLNVAGNAGNNKEIHSRAYSTALAAMMAGKKVSIYSYADQSVCTQAAYIRVFN